MNNQNIVYKYCSSPCDSYRYSSDSCSFCKMGVSKKLHNILLKIKPNAKYVGVRVSDDYLRDEFKGHDLVLPLDSNILFGLENYFNFNLVKSLVIHKGNIYLPFEIQGSYGRNYGGLNPRVTQRA